MPPMDIHLLAKLNVSRCLISELRIIMFSMQTLELSTPPTRGAMNVPLSFLTFVTVLLFLKLAFMSTRLRMVAGEDALLPFPSHEKSPKPLSLLSAQFHSTVMVEMVYPFPSKTPRKFLLSSFVALPIGIQ